MGSSTKSSDSVKVAVRVRPLNEREKSLNPPAHGVSWNLTSSSVTQMTNKKPVQANSFVFDHVFLENINNEDVYTAIAKNLVESTVEGLNGVIFAYGQTAAGKTHTMLGTESEPGITRRSITDLFASIAASQGRGFLLRASYIEIYNEEIKDLLGGADSGNLKIHEDVVNKRVYVNSKEEVVTSIQDVMDMISAGEHTRAVGVTNMNDRSSRSHTIFTIKVESRELNTAQASDDDDYGGDGVAVRASTLTLVDLAGSERAAHTKAEGQRLKEGGHINKSLLTLGTVINKLSSGETAAHIPYRDSKLTRILQPALGGNARTAILCAVTPSVAHMDETLSTLRFASRAKKVTNNAHRNEFLDDRAKLKRALKEISSLKTMMSALKKSGIKPRGSQSVGPSKEDDSKKRIEFFKTKFEKLCTISNSQDPDTRGTKRPSESNANIEPAAKIAKLDLRASVDSRGIKTVHVPDSWDKVGKLREALDLCGEPHRSASLQFCASNSKETDQADADLRMRALKAEKELKKVKSEIEYERTAMEAEVDQLQIIADNAERAQESAQIEWTEAVSTLKSAQARSFVDEIIEGAMMISERDGKLAKAAKQIKKYKVVEQNFEKTKTELSTTEKSLSEALKREKRGVGPVIKEKSKLEKDLKELEYKFKTSRENTHRLQSEKAALERVSKTKDMEMKSIQKDLDKLRKKQDSVDNRVKNEQDARKKVEKAKKEIENTLEAEIKLRSKESKAFEKEKKEIESNFNKEKADIETEKKKLEDEKNALETNLATETELRTKLEEAKKELESNLATEKTQRAVETKALEEAKKELTSKLEVEISQRAEETNTFEQAKKALETNLTTEKSERAKEKQAFEEFKKGLESNLAAEKSERAKEASVFEEAMKEVQGNLEASKLAHAEVSAAFETSKQQYETVLVTERSDRAKEVQVFQELKSQLESNLATEKSERTKETQVSTLAINQLTGNLTTEKAEREKEANMFREAIKAVETNLEMEKNLRAQYVKTAEEEITQVKTVLENERTERAQEVYIFESAMKEMEKNLSVEKLEREADEKKFEDAMKQVQGELSAEKSGRSQERNAYEQDVANAKSIIESEKEKSRTLESQMKNTADKLESVQASADNLKKELREYKAKVHSAQTEREDMKQRLKDCQEELEKEKEDSATELENASKLIKTGKNLLEHLRINHENYKESMEKKVEDLSEKYEEKEMQQGQAEKNLAEAQKKYDTMETEHKKLQVELTGLREKFNTMEAVHVKLQSETTETKKMYEAMETEHKELQTETTETREKYVAIVAENEKLQGELQEAKENYHAMETERTKLQSELVEARNTEKKRGLSERSENVINANNVMSDQERELYEKKCKKLALRVDQLLKEHGDAAREKVNQLEAKVTLMKRNEHLEEQLIQYGRGEGVIAKYADRITKYQRRKAVMESERVKLKTLLKNQGLEGEADLLNRLAEAEGKVTGIEEELEAAKKNGKVQEDENDKLKQELHKYRQKLNHREAQWMKSLGNSLAKERKSLKKKYDLKETPPKEEVQDQIQEEMEA